MKRRNKIIIHVVFWLLCASMSTWAWGEPYYNKDYAVAFFRIQFGTQFFNALYFYLNYFLLVPLFLDKKYWLFGFWSIILFGFHLYCDFWNWNLTLDSVDTNQFGAMVNECIFYGMVAIGFRMMEGWAGSEQQKQDLEKELKQTELLFLQSQMSPHFLFNTLNNIYGLSLNNSPKTSVAISQLKDLMRYFQYFEKGGKILLAKELLYLEGFIELHRMRNSVDIVFTQNLSADLNHIYIEPMLLLPFVENAFKHGDLNQRIEVGLDVSAQRVNFSVKNNISLAKRKDAVGGIGVKNIERRLELLYPQKHHIRIENQNDIFFLNMTINLV